MGEMDLNIFECNLRGIFGDIIVCAGILTSVIFLGNR